MNINYLKDHLKGKEEIITKMLVAVSVIFGVMILVRTGTVFGELIKEKRAVKKAVEQCKLDAKKSGEYFVKPKAVADGLKKKNLFSPPPSLKKPAVEQVSGIFGDEALINGKWYKAGDKVQDAEIVAVEATRVRIRMDGQEKSFSPISSTSSGSSEGQRSATSSGQSSQRSGGSDRGFGDRGGDRGGFHGPTQEEIDKYRNMTEEQKKEFRDSMRERFRGR